MGRSLTSYIDDEISKKSTLPFYLIEIGFIESGTYRFTTLDVDVSWNGFTWTRGVAEVIDINEEDNGAKSGSISITNQDNFASSIIYSEGPYDHTVKIWKLYGDGPYSAGDAVLLFDGLTDGGEAFDLYFTLNIDSSEFKIQSTPRIVCNSLLFSRLPQPGVVITWGDQKVVLKGGEEQEPKSVWRTIHHSTNYRLQR